MGLLTAKQSAADRKLSRLGSDVWRAEIQGPARFEWGRSGSKLDLSLAVSSQNSSAGRMGACNKRGTRQDAKEAYGLHGELGLLSGSAGLNAAPPSLRLYFPFQDC